ncbi:MAG: glycerophosphodiester phosphodiesterase [Anaerolineae bacterium]|nr:glycerophosphodiester phosphodiesterase [Anaerolineae bacterium]
MADFPEDWWYGNGRLHPQRPLILGHRGASHMAPQNTLAAFHKAFEVGADGIELDVQLSVDGVPVVIHDATVDATTNGTGFVAEFSLAQLKALDAGTSFSPAFIGERIPTLEEVLMDIGDKLLINIELKAPTSRAKGLEEAVVGVVRRTGMQKRVWFSSFKPYALYRSRQLAPEIPCGLLYGTQLRTLLLRPFTPYEALHPAKELVTEAGIRRAHRRGLRVAVWTVDDPDQARQLAEWGVDAIITNEPALLLNCL